MNPLVKANQFYLRQALTLLASFDEATFRAVSPDCYHSTVGQHLRHCIEHYQSFLQGLPSGAIDYDKRNRNQQLETDLAFAVEVISEIERQLNELSAELDDTQTMKIRMNQAGEKGWQTSSVGRELQFLMSHTVHHFALVGIICHGKEIPLEDGFGVAPSTLHHRSEAEPIAARDERQALH